MQTNRLKRAFTLIELLVVIAIIAILAAILFPVFAQAKLAAKKAASISNVKNMSLGLIMYTSDYDDLFSDSEWGSGSSSPPNYRTYSNWATDNNPYIKSGTFHPETGWPGGQDNGADGIYQDPAAPTVTEAALGQSDLGSSVNPDHQWGFSYGVNENILVHNEYSDNPSYLSGGQLSTSMSQTQIPTIADTIMLMTKGVETPTSTGDDQGWTFPYFATLQREYIGSVTASGTVGAPVVRDGDDSAIDPQVAGTVLADGFIENPFYDTDCASDTCHNSWENVGHPRYRYSKVGVAAYSDGHAKAMIKGQLKWYKNIFVSNPGISMANASWCGEKGGACTWGGIYYAVTPY